MAENNEEKKERKIRIHDDFVKAVEYRSITAPGYDDGYLVGWARCSALAEKAVENLNPELKTKFLSELMKLAILTD